MSFFRPHFLFLSMLPGKMAFLLSAAFLSLSVYGLSRIQHGCQTVSYARSTNYGYPDASSTTNFTCSGSTYNPASADTPLGDGSSAKPYALATSETSTGFAYCEIIYVPYFRKYFQFVDTCEQCRKHPYPFPTLIN